MMKAIYKRKGRNYQWQGERKGRSVSSGMVSLLSRAGVFVVGSIRYGASLIVTRVNAIGIPDSAEFTDKKTAMQWLYGAIRNESPQLSLFHGVL